MANNAYTDLIGIIRKQGAALNPREIEFGEIISTNPLQITIGGAVITRDIQISPSMANNFEIHAPPEITGFPDDIVSLHSWCVSLRSALLDHFSRQALACGDRVALQRVAEKNIVLAKLT